ncbi:M57 family metalloprotease [Luteipulveratus mongoliensis]|uniref:Peptidase M16 n=1 Tax=Luteipulveratus mongoliensis TaxID=571913 RepID=A0A0K1JFM1_9MICO|nr:M57 family metalloprotease [Luteipulveratus mongoliensis]AKU15390.1 peptidase M16 [Luteipulveratus mongoliensis]
MKRRTTKVVLAAAVLAASTGLAGAGSAQAKEINREVPTFQEFKAATVFDHGVYIVNGDEPVGDLAHLKAYYDRMVGESSGGKQASLIVNTVGGADDVWDAGTLGNLTYCVSDAFGDRKADIVAAMEGGGGNWENASPAIDFKYDSSQDGSCNTSNSNVLFSVEPVDSGGQYIARAFFPSSPKSERNVLVDASIWSSGSWTPSNILGHELGHTLGFRHEHTRPEAGTCFEDNNWRELTPYDSASIMHYPQCNGSSSDLSFSQMDGEGVRALYGG